MSKGVMEFFKSRMGQGDISFVCFAFGGSNCPVIYNFLSDATTYMDDMLGGTPTYGKGKSPLIILVLTKRACYVSKLIIFCTGYFLNKKCVFELVTRIPYFAIDKDMVNSSGFPKRK